MAIAVIPPTRPIRAIAALPCCSAARKRYRHGQSEKDQTTAAENAARSGGLRAAAPGDDPLRRGSAADWARERGTAPRPQVRRAHGRGGQSTTEGRAEK